MNLTVDISERSHKIAEQISKRDGVSLSQVFESAVESYRRQKFLEETDRAFAAFKTDAEAWRDEQIERELWEQSLSDGIIN